MQKHKINNGEEMIMQSLSKLMAIKKAFFILISLSIFIFSFTSVSYAETVGAWKNVAGAVSVKMSNPQRSRRSPDAKVSITLSNISESNISEPLRLVISNLTSSETVSISNASGMTDSGDSYIDLATYIGNNFVKGAKTDAIEIQVAGGKNIFSFTPLVEKFQEEDEPQPQLTVQISTPATLTTVGASPIAIQGVIDDPAATLTVNGVPVTHSNGNFAANVALEEGHNVILVRAIASDGTETTDSISVALDTTPPFITIESPLNGSTVNNASIAVSGLINDIVRGTVNDNQAVVKVNNQIATVSNRSYLAQAITLEEGENTVTVSGSDEQGNTSSTSITVTYVTPEIKKIALVSGQNQAGEILSVLSEP